MRRRTRTSRPGSTSACAATAASRHTARAHCEQEVRGNRFGDWGRLTQEEMEDSGQHEVLNWFGLLGAMEELGRKPDRATFIETWAFVSPVVFAHYSP